MKSLIAIAWRNLWRHTWRSLATAVAMALGVAMMMAMICFQDGMYAEIFDVMIEQRLGHVQVNHPDYPSKRILHDTVESGEELVERIEALPRTVAVSPRLNGFALVGGASKSTGGLIVGIDPERAAAATPLPDRIREGRYLEGSGEAIVGYKLLEELELSLGDGVLVVTQAADGSLGNAVYDVVGVYKSGDAQMDRIGLYATLADVQELLVLPDQFHQATVLSDDASDIPPFAASIRELVGDAPVQVQPWWEADPSARQLMDLRDVGSAVLLVIVFGAAGFGILNTMLMSVFERTRELGVLRALGLRPGRLVGMVLVESMFLAALATSIGLVIGGGLDWYLVTYGLDMGASVSDGFDFQGVVLDPVIKGVVRPGALVSVVAMVFVVTFFASLWPAWRAASLQPVEAIRAE